MNLVEIIRDWLRSHPDYDGLANPDLECGCDLEDLIPCEMPDFRDCQAGHLKDGFLVARPKNKNPQAASV